MEKDRKTNGKGELAECKNCIFSAYCERRRNPGGGHTYVWCGSHQFASEVEKL